MEDIKVGEEIWKPIKGYEGKYEISNKGRVRSVNTINKLGRNIKGRLLKQDINKRGYHIITLYKEGWHNMRVHRLVAQEFIPNPENKPEVNHIDGNKSNNTVSNLEWATSKENMRHAFKKGLAFGGNKISVNKYDINNNFIRSYESLTQASKDNNIKPDNLSKKLRKGINEVGGFIWKYRVEES